MDIVFHTDLLLWVHSCLQSSSFPPRNQSHSPPKNYGHYIDHLHAIYKIYRDLTGYVTMLLGGRGSDSPNNGGLVSSSKVMKRGDLYQPPRVVSYHLLYEDVTPPLCTGGLAPLIWNPSLAILIPYDGRYYRRGVHGIHIPANLICVCPIQHD